MMDSSGADPLRAHNHPHQDPHHQELSQTLVYEIGSNLLHALRDNPVALAKEILSVLHSISERIDTMNQTIAALQAQVASDNAAIKVNLANAAADISNLNGQIQALNDKLAAGQVLTQDDVDALSSIASGSADLVTSTQALADTVADVPPPVDVPPTDPIDPGTGLPLAQRRR